MQKGLRENPNWTVFLFNISCSFFFQTMCKCHKSCLSLSLACMYRSQHHHSIILKLRIQATYLRIARKSLENPRLCFLGQPPSKLPFFLSSLALASQFSLLSFFFLIWPNQQGGMGGGFDLLFYLILLQNFNPRPCLLIATHALHYSCPYSFVFLS